MTYQRAYEIYGAVTNCKEEKQKVSLLKKCVAYAQIRADWKLSDREKQIEMDTPRRLAHNALIDSINILARMIEQVGGNIEWYAHLKNNRYEIGEFACWVHCFLALKA